MVQYKGIVKKRTPERKILLTAGGGIILFLSFMRHNVLYICVAIILMLAIFFEKEHIVDEKGVHIVYNFFGIKIPYSWSWDVITAMRPDYKKAAPNIYMEIAKDVTIRAFTFSKKDAIGVMELAKRMNPDMYVDDRDEQQREHDNEEHRAKMAYARERAKAEKKAKKKK